MIEKAELNTKQAKAIPLILAERTLEDGFKAAGICKSAFYDWMKDEAFKAEFERQRDAIAEIAFETLCRNVSKAASVLVGLLDNSDKRLSRFAAKDVLDYFLRHREQNDILRRLEAIEEKLG